MRIGRWRWGATLAGLLVVVLVVLGTLAGLRWRAAGTARTVIPPAGAVAPAGTDDERAVRDRAAIVARSMRTGRGPATVRAYAVPPATPWLQARQIVATQLDHWVPLGPCPDRLNASIVECAWREPSRWWPREVRLTMLRLPPVDGSRDRRIFVVIGSGPGSR